MDAIRNIDKQQIDGQRENNIIYDYIYDSVVEYCVEQIENGNYKEAYSRYKSSILCLEKQFAKPLLEQKLVKTLKRVRV